MKKTPVFFAFMLGMALCMAVFTGCGILGGQREPRAQRTDRLPRIELTAAPEEEPSPAPTAEPVTEPEEQPEEETPTQEPPVPFDGIGIHPEVEDRMEEVYSSFRDDGILTMGTVSVDGLPIADNDREAFDSKDLLSGTLRLGMTQQEVVDLMGLPAQGICYRDVLRDTPQMEWTYSDGSELHFDTYSEGNPYLLRVATIATPSTPGPRDIRVGDSLQDALSLFRIELPPAKQRYLWPEYSLLYAQRIRASSFGDIWAYGEYGFITSEVSLRPGESGEEAFEICYYRLDGEIPEADFDDWAQYRSMYIPYYSFSVQIREGRVVSYTWAYNYGAE